MKRGGSRQIRLTKRRRAHEPGRVHARTDTWLQQIVYNYLSDGRVDHQDYGNGVMRTTFAEIREGSVLKVKAKSGDLLVQSAFSNDARGKWKQSTIPFSPERRIGSGDIKDPAMKAMIDRIARSPVEVHVRENKSLAPGSTKTQLLQNKETGAFSVRINWNPHAAASVKGGSQSPAMVLGHEGNHAERYIRDPQGALRDTNLPVPGFGNREEQRVITGPEANGARTLGETPRNDGDARFYPVEDVTDR